MCKIGVYLCKCGGMISEHVDLDVVEKAAKTMEHVAVVRRHDLYCGADGLKVVAEDIAQGKINRVVTVACSPKLHHKTFAECCKAQGLNPYLIHMVNIREQCVWTTPDKDKATQKVIRLMRGGILRAAYQEELEQKDLEVNPDVLIVGGGIVGVEAALLLAKAGRKVTLMEKRPAFGGVLPKLEHTYPSGECSPCILAPRMSELLDQNQIDLIDSAEIESVVGFGGNFTVRINQKPRYVISKNCISCMMCIEACPASIPNEFNAGRDKRKAVDFYFPGCVPRAPHIDEKACLRFQGQECSACQEACDFSAIDYDQKQESKEVKVGSILLAIGGQLYEAKNVFPEANRVESNVVTSLEFERLMSTTGPTGGKILTSKGTPPQSVAILHCVGSRADKHLPYCSGICCKYSLKYSESIKKQIPGCQVTHVYADLNIDGQQMQRLVDALVKDGVQFRRWKLGRNSIADIKPLNDRYLVSGRTVSDQSDQLEVDMIILAMGLKPQQDIIALSEMLSLTENDSFVDVQNDKISPVATTVEGVYLAGTVKGPKDIAEAVTEGKASAAEILSTYVPGRKLLLEPATAESDATLCGGCQVCVALCPYKAPQFDVEQKMVIVNEALCKGCGTCVAACPSGAMRAKHFTKQQIRNEIKGILQDE